MHWQNFTSMNAATHESAMKLAAKKCVGIDFTSMNAATHESAMKLAAKKCVGIDAQLSSQIRSTSQGNAHEVQFEVFCAHQGLPLCGRHEQILKAICTSCYCFEGKLALG